MEICIAKNSTPIVAAAKPEADPVEWAVEQISGPAGALISEGVESVDELARGSDSLAEMAGNIYGLFPSMPVREFADVMAEAMVAVRLAGMYEVDNGR